MQEVVDANREKNAAIKAVELLNQATQEISDRDKRIDELLVVIDTAQAALRRAESTITDSTDKQHVFNRSAKWVMEFK